MQWHTRRPHRPQGDESDRPELCQSQIYDHDQPIWRQLESGCGALALTPAHERIVCAATTSSHNSQRGQDMAVQRQYGTPGSSVPSRERGPKAQGGPAMTSRTGMPFSIRRAHMYFDNPRSDTPLSNLDNESDSRDCIS